MTSGSPTSSLPPGPQGHIPMKASNLPKASLSSSESSSKNNSTALGTNDAPQTQVPKKATAPSAFSPHHVLQPSYAISHSPPPSFRLSSLGASFSIPASNFIIGCSPILFHIPTLSVVLVHDTYSNSFFLPRGRKDCNESLPSCALREGYEESGFRGKLISWGSPGTLQPEAPGDDQDSNTEAFWVQLRPVLKRDGTIVHYFTYYFIGIILDDAKPDEDRSRLVGRHEQGYVGKLVKISKATTLLAKQGQLARIFHSKPGSFERGIDSGLVFVPSNSSGGSSKGSEWEDFTTANSLRENGKIWIETPSDQEWQDIDKSEEKGEGKGEGKKGRAAARSKDQQEFIDGNTAEALSDQGKGILVPASESGDDTLVQARVILEAWNVIMKIYGEKESK